MADLRHAQVDDIPVDVFPKGADMSGQLTGRDAYEGQLEYWKQRAEDAERTLTKAREALARYPEMTDAEAVTAAGRVTALLFSEQGAATDG